MSRSLEESNSKLLQCAVQLQAAMEQLAAEKALREELQLCIHKAGVGELLNELEQAQRERSEAAGKEVVRLIELGHINRADVRIAELEAKLLAEQAAGAEMRQIIQDVIGLDPTVWDRIDHALSTTHGASFLEERERHVGALEAAKPILKAIFIGPEGPGLIAAQNAYELVREALKTK